MLPTLSAGMTKLPVPLFVPPISLAPVAFVTGIDPPVTMDLSDRAAPFDEFAVDRDFFARTDPQMVADRDRVVSHFGPMIAADLRKRRLKPHTTGTSTRSI